MCLESERPELHILKPLNSNLANQSVMHSVHKTSMERN